VSILFNAVSVTNFRSIKNSGPIPLGSVTVVIGRNNVGKSSLLRGIYSLQDGSGIQSSDIRIGETESSITLAFPREIPASLHSYPGVKELAVDTAAPGAPALCSPERRRGEHQAYSRRKRYRH